MKKIYYKTLALLAIALSTYSCSADWLDLEPSDEAASDVAIRNVSDAKIALNGVYNIIKGSSSATEYYAADMIYYGDVRGDDMQTFVESSNRTNWAYEMRYSISGADNMWYIPYSVINRSNKLIKAIEDGQVKDGDAAVVNNIKGQAVMARALAHFDLLRVYSLPYDVSTNGDKYGIPVVTKPQTPDAQNGRNTIKEVYTQVITDLTEAINLMNADNKVSFFNSWTAKLLLARVYLYQGDNTKAFELSEDLIKNSPYRLWTTDEYASAWSITPSSQKNTESLFEIGITNTNDWTDRGGIAYLYNQNGYAEAHITKAFYDLLNKDYVNDARIGALKESQDENAENLYKKKVWINKYPGRVGESDFRIGNIVLFRLSEAYLIAAEAAEKRGDLTSAAKYLNTIILRGNPEATPVTTSEATLDRILQERRVEFVGEGHRFFDLIRNNKPIVRYTDESNRGWHQPLDQASKQFNRTYFRVILPIPKSETDANPNIAKQQNPGY